MKTRVGAFLVAGACVLCLTACGSSTSVSELSASRSICSTVNGIDYFPSVPAGGAVISRQSAILVEKLLNDAQLDALKAEAAPLQRAIDSHSESRILKVFNTLQNECSSLGVSPAT